MGYSDIAKSIPYFINYRLCNFCNLRGFQKYCRLKYCFYSHIQYISTHSDYHQSRLVHLNRHHSDHTTNQHSEICSLSSSSFTNSFSKFSLSIVSDFFVLYLTLSLYLSQAIFSTIEIVAVTGIPIVKASIAPPCRRFLINCSGPPHFFAAFANSA